MSVNRTQIKKAIKQARVFQWQIADYLCISESEFSKIWRKEITDEQANEIYLAIDHLKNNHGDKDGN